MTEEEKEIDYKREYEILQLQLHLLREEKDNLIRKLQKEIAKLRNKKQDLLRKLRNRVKEVKKLEKYSLYKKEFSRLNATIEDKNKQIDLMANTILEDTFQLETFWCNGCFKLAECPYKNPKECIVKYFEKQAKEV